MSIRVKAQKDALATAYGTQAPYGACFTADPGTGGAATNEVTGGSPAYARKALAWSAPNASSAIVGSGTFDIPAGTTVTYFGVTVGSVAGTADVRDSAAVTSQAFASQGTYQVTPTYTQT
jgi:hypothetical protein